VGWQNVRVIGLVDGFWKNFCLVLCRLDTDKACSALFNHNCPGLRLTVLCKPSIECHRAQLFASLFKRVETAHFPQHIDKGKARDDTKKNESLVGS
jgi:hypothetical protein